MSTRIMSPCWQLRMPPPAKAVLISLADMANDDGYCWPSIERLCERTCFGRTAVIDAIYWLETHAVLKAHRTNGRKTTYTVMPDRFSEMETVEVVKKSSMQSNSELSSPAEEGGNQSATRTRPPRGPVRHADPTSPPDGPDQSATRTLTVITVKEPIPPVSPVGDARDFEQLVQIWPAGRRQRLEEARVQYDRVVGKGIATSAELLSAARLQSTDDVWRRDAGRFVPLLLTWLRKSRWKDGRTSSEQVVWHASKQGVEARAAQVGIEPWDRTAFDAGRGEAWPAYLARVLARDAEVSVAQRMAA